MEPTFCKKCRKPIDGQYLKIEGWAYHLGCFVCQGCKRPIDGAYQKYRFKYYHPGCYKQKAGLRCHYCGELLDDQWVTSNRKNYHPLCYKQFIQPHCHLCGREIQGKYALDDQKAYHLDCFKQVKLPKCDCCRALLSGRYLVDPWGNKAHPKHRGKATPTCSSCSRIISESTSHGGYTLSDGRNICGLCNRTAIKEVAAVNHAKAHVIHLLRNFGIQNDLTAIPLELVNLKTLRKMAPQHVSRFSKGFTQSRMQYVNGTRTAINHSIYILFGLPRLEFEGVLAHEYLHTWINDHNVTLSRKHTEGVCNIAAMLIYEADSSKMARVLLNNMETNPDPYYGAGYRQMKKRWGGRGWQVMFQTLAQQRTAAGSPFRRLIQKLF